MGRTGRLTALALLGALPLLSGCLLFDAASTVAWSPSGGRVVFLSEGRPWVYTLGSGKLESLPGDGRYLSVSWSPREEWLAVSTAAYVETFHENAGVFESSQTISTSKHSADLSTLMWHPDGRRLLYSEFEGETAETTEVDIESGAVSHLGAGVGLYGPGGDWLLWAVPISIGKRGDTVVFDRQTPAGDPLPSDPQMRRLSEDFVDLLAGINDHSALPLCGRADAEFLCLDGKGALERRAVLPAEGRVFPDRRRELFALVEDPQGKEPKLAVYDAQGKLKADGRNFLKAIFEAAKPEEKDDADAQVSRLAWSPDGNWLAWVVNGRLALWNWRNDEIRIHAAPGAQ